MDAIEKQRVECLVLAQAFETYWAYYLQSEGQLFDPECRQVGLRFLQALEALARADPNLSELVQREHPISVELRRDREEDTATNGPGREGQADGPDGAPARPPVRMNLNPGAIRLKLAEWAQSTQAFPFGSARKSRVFIWSYLTAVKKPLLASLGLSQDAVRPLPRAELAHLEGVVKWRGHLPLSALRADPDQVVRAASAAPSVVVVGYIRKSQDLMTYADDPQAFSTRMVRFITVTRQLVEENNGFFDKFTGDGFLAYFNEAICRRAGQGHLDSFLSFIRQESAFVRDHFAEWARTIRKLPTSEIGLAVGADCGIVKFHDVGHHLVAVGESIVWATRMSAVASANEVAVNNLLFAALEGRAGLAFQSRIGKTKAGEEFLARMLAFHGGG